jgi:hypothetical protein
MCFCFVFKQFTEKVKRRRSAAVEKSMHKPVKKHKQKCTINTLLDNSEDQAA